MRWSDSALPFGRSHPECRLVATVCAYSMSLVDSATRCVAEPQAPHPLPEPRHSVAIEDRVGADQGQRFDQALGGEHPVFLLLGQLLHEGDHLFVRQFEHWHRRLLLIAEGM